MKKNENGFFLAETIIVLALVTTIMAFVFPNVSKLYDNYKTRIKYYDQTEDIIFLSELYKIDEVKTAIENKTKGCCGDKGKTSKAACTNAGFADEAWMIGAKNISNLESINLPTEVKNWQDAYGEIKLYVTSYMANVSDSSDYSFSRYLKRIKKTNNDKTAYRLIGKFKTKDTKIYRYASIKIVLPESCGINFN